MTDRTRPSRLRLLALPVAVAALATAGATTALTGAFFTDTATVGSNVFTTGTVVLNATENASLPLDMSGMYPGSQKVGEITVANAGSLALRYSATNAATTTNNLAGNLEFDVKTGVTTCSDAGYDATGTQLNGTSDFFSATTVFGSATTGQQTGDRTLNAGASEKLCIRVKLPTTAPNSVQGSTATGTLTFTAEQLQGT